MRSYWLPLTFPLALPLALCSLLFAATVGVPMEVSFDEVHYLTAAKKIIEFKELANFEHPPLAKLILGMFWLVLHKLLGFNELIAVRIPVILAGLTVLYTFSKLLTSIALPKSFVHPLLWTVILNMCWYVQSKTAMPDMISLSFAALSMYFAFTKKFTLSGAFFGFAMASKWSAAPYAVLLLYLARNATPLKIFLATVAGAATYYMSFVPLMFIEQSQLTPTNFIDFQFTMYHAVVHNAGAQGHSYSSDWWQWLLLIRPMWYTFAPILTADGIRDKLYSCVFMGGNPFVFLTGTLAVVYSIVFLTHRKLLTPRARGQALNPWPLVLFVISICMYVILPKKTNFFYYVVPASLWFGPVIASALLTKLSERHTLRTLWALNALALLFFIYMLPITSGSAVPLDSFHTLYTRWMGALNWI